MLNSGTFSQLGTHSAMALDGDGLRGKARNWRIEKMVKLVGEEGMEKKEGREKEGLVLLPRYWYVQLLSRRVSVRCVHTIVGLATAMYRHL